MDEFDEHRLTADRETSREWAEEHGVRPVRTTETGESTEESHPYRLRSETERTEAMESLSWDEFFEGIETNDLVVVSGGESVDRPPQVVSRDRAMSHTSLEPGEFEDRLLAGETITTEVTDTTVVERVLVDQATVESEVVDTEPLDGRIVDVELLSRTIGGCEVIDRDLLDDVDRSRFENVSQLTGGFQENLSRPISVEVDVEEDWAVTRELLERATIESRIVDTESTEMDEVESESREGSIDIERIQQALLESDIMEVEADTEEVIRSDTIESEFREDDLVRTQLNQLRVVEDEISERKVLRGELTDSEVVDAETRTSTPLGTSFVDRNTLGEEGSPGGMTAPDIGTDTAAGEGSMAAGEEGSTAAGEEGSMTTEGDERAMSAMEDERSIVTPEDEGKRVVSADGETLGMVEEVRENKAYINPEPGIVERIKSKLGWGDADEEDYTVGEENIERITNDEVELSVPRQP